MDAFFATSGSHISVRGDSGYGRRGVGGTKTKEGREGERGERLAGRRRVVRAFEELPPPNWRDKDDNGEPRTAQSRGPSPGKTILTPE